MEITIDLGDLTDRHSTELGKHITRAVRPNAHKGRCAVFAGYAHLHVASRASLKRARLLPASASARLLALDEKFDEAAFDAAAFSAPRGGPAGRLAPDD